MKTFQKGIFDQSSSAYFYLEYKVELTDYKLFLEQLKSATSINNGGVYVVTSFGKRLWDLISPKWSPTGFINFETLIGEKGFTMPSTQLDLMFWIHGKDESSVLDVALAVHEQLKNVAQLAYEQKGFDYHNSHDLTKFEDGTGNPKTDDNRVAAAIIPEGQVGESGSMVFTQQWIHNLGKFNNQPISHQEKIIGRTKKDSIELTGDHMPHDSHVSRTDIAVDGVAMKMWRRSTPFGGVKEHGLNFHCFACETIRISSQLDSMLGRTEDKVTDRILEFSKPIRGAYWFCPSQEDLIQLFE
ncbi:Dyp-type peroxidase [Cyclobacteriaceae bacterium]|nr:Dyp-type peroxidase [Cyclobacteriaceae bacterium]